MYHLKVASLKVLESILHFKESLALMIAIWALMEAKCSRGSLLSSNVVNEGV